MRKPPRSYPPDFRQKLLAPARSGRRHDELAHQFNLAPQTVRNSCKQRELDADTRSDDLTSEERAELSKLSCIIEAFALQCVSVADGEEMHRILYYNCSPYEGDGRNKPHPIDGATAPVSTGKQNVFSSVLSLLKAKPYFAARSVFPYPTALP